MLALSFARPAPLAAATALSPSSFAAVGSPAPPLTPQIGFVLPSVIIVRVKGVHRALGQSWNWRRSVGHARFVSRMALPVPVRPARRSRHHGLAIIATAAVAATAGSGGRGVVKSAAALAAATECCFPHIWRCCSGCKKFVLWCFQSLLCRINNRSRLCKCRVSSRRRFQYNWSVSAQMN